ncbi:MAG: hypothetical protein IT523_08260 [Burkholderiales bacterium]|nr:hypothetical protein [Burkholderiales bacterium]
MIGAAEYRQRQFAAWGALSAEERIEVMRRMAREGWSDHGIAAACSVSVEYVRRSLGPRPQEAGAP